MPLALYRRYRPETFAEVIGQEHVTDPLTSALRAGRIGHAYLFSGPRGCGKTTSARILARCLNCAEGPTDTPCGVCDSCVELARGGPGSLDVVENDAASHGGVDDARELRDRATFATARDRFKVFIIDEAHMVSPQGVEALRGDHVRLVDDIDLVMAVDRREERLLPQVPGVVDTAMAGRVDLDDVYRPRSAPRQVPATGALAARLGDRRPLAVQRPGQDARAGGLAAATRAGEQVGVVRPPGRQCLPQRRGHVVLADHLGERLRPVAAIQGEGGVHPGNPNHGVRRSTGAPGQRRPLAHPVELTDPCCLPALGELGKLPPREGLAPS